MLADVGRMARAINDLVEQVNRLSQWRALPPLALEQSSYGQLLYLEDRSGTADQVMTDPAVGPNEPVFIPFLGTTGAPTYVPDFGSHPSVVDGAGVLWTWSGTAWLSAPGGGGGGAGTVTSVNVSGGSTGLTFAGGPVTTAGVITMAGTLAVASGGTGATTAGGALTNLGGISQGTADGRYVSTVVEVDGTPSISPVATLRLDSSTGLALAGSAGVATASLLAATPTQQGGVSTSSQTFAGAKSFNASLTTFGS